MRMSVDFPAPFSPTMAWISPVRTARLTPSLATTPGKRLVISRSSIKRSVMMISRKKRGGGSRPPPPDRLSRSGSLQRLEELLEQLLVRRDFDLPGDDIFLQGL